MARNVGDRRRLRFTFQDLDEALADPSTVTLELTDPSQNIATYTYAGAEIVKDSVGVYHYDVLWDEAGQWRCHVVSTGSPAVAEWEIYWVEP